MMRKSREILTSYQGKLLANPARNVLTLGGIGAAKTRALAQFITRFLLKFPGEENFGCVANNTHKQLHISTWDEIKKYFAKHQIGYKGPDSYGIVRLPNDARFILLNTEVDYAEQLKGPEYSFIAWDEVQTIRKEEVYNVLIDRCRRKPDERIIDYLRRVKKFTDEQIEDFKLNYNKIRLFGNAVPPTHFLARDYAIPSTKLPGYDFMSVTTYENAHNLPPGKIAELESRYPPGSNAHKRQMLGALVALEGTCYPEFVNNQDFYCIDESEVPDTATNFAYALDFGGVNPYAFLEGRIDNRGRLFITDEYYQGDMAVSQIVPYIKEIYKRGPIFADHDAAGRKELQMHNITTSLAFKDVDIGIQMVRHMFIRNNLFIVAKKCPNLIRELNGYTLKTLSGREVPVKENDHAVDALRYLVATIYRS